MAKRTTNKIEALEQELRQALISKQYEKAKEIQGKLDYIFLESLKNNIMIECNSEKIAMTWGCNSRVLNKKYLHHKETHRKDFKFIPIKGTIERVYVLR